MTTVVRSELVPCPRLGISVPVERVTDGDHHALLVAGLPYVEGSDGLAAALLLPHLAASVCRRMRCNESEGA